MVGLVQPGRKRFLVRSPALLVLASDGVNAGIRLTDVLDLIGALRDQLGGLADTLADQIVDRLWEPLAADGRTAEIEVLLRRGRLLLLQGAVSTLADGLGAALLQRSDTATDGDGLRTALDNVRGGAVTDLGGRIEHRKPR